MTLGNKFREHRLNKGFNSLYQVEDKTMIRRMTVADVENGNTIPSITTLYALAYIYKLNKKQVSELIELRKKVLENE